MYVFTRNGGHGSKGLTYGSYILICECKTLNLLLLSFLTRYTLAYDDHPDRVRDSCLFFGEHLTAEGLVVRTVFSLKRKNQKPCIGESRNDHVKR